MPQTAAVYWESKVGIYGFREKTSLVLASIIFPETRLAYWGRVLQGLSHEQNCFDLSVLQRRDGKEMQLCLVFEGSSHSAALLRIREAQKNEASTSLTLDFPVEMVSFHGPHFQDRYGLTQAASNSLESGNLPVLVMGCAGTSISLVVPQGCAKAAVRLLGKTFVVP